MGRRTPTSTFYRVARASSTERAIRGRCRHRSVSLRAAWCQRLAPNGTSQPCSHTGSGPEVRTHRRNEKRPGSPGPLLAIPRAGFHRPGLRTIRPRAPAFALSSEHWKVCRWCRACRRIAWITAPALTGSRGNARRRRIVSWALDRRWSPEMARRGDARCLPLRFGSTSRMNPAT